MADAKQNLDGKTPVKPIPFDAHEQATRGTHVPTSADSPDKDPATVVKFPKAVDHVPHPSGVGKLPVVVNSAEEEQAYLDAKDAEEAAAKASKKKAKDKPAAE